MATYNSSIYKNQIDANIKKYYATRNKILVTAPTDSYVTASHNETTLEAIEVLGTWTFYYDDFGTWTIAVSNGQQYATEDVEIDELKDYLCDIQFEQEENE